jgi:hypothetical protein
MFGQSIANIEPHPGVHRIQALPAGEAGGVSESFAIQVDWVMQEEISPPEQCIETVSNAGSRSWVAEDRDEVRFWTEDLALNLDLVNHRGHLSIANGMGWHNALRVLYFYSYLKNQGVLLHASGILHCGKALVFPGLSGAGKTTIVRHSPGKTILSDEVVGVGLNPQGVGPIACGTPFIGDWGGVGTEVAAPLQGLFFPAQSQENRLEPLTPSETLARLLPCIITYTTFLPRQRQLVELAGRLAQASPGFLLHFRPEQDFWQVLNAA